MSTSGVTGGCIWAILTCSKRENPQACLTRGSYAGYHTRWRGLESYLLQKVKVGLRLKYIGSKRGNPQVCLTRPVFAPFSLKVAWSRKSFIATAIAT